MSEQYIELANKGYMLPDQGVITELLSYELSDFEIVWSAAVRKIKEVNGQSGFVVLDGTWNSIEWDPINSLDPEEIRFYEGGDRTHWTLTLSPDGAESLDILIQGGMDWNDEQYKYPGLSSKTLNHLSSLARRLLSNEGKAYQTQSNTTQKAKTEPFESRENEKPNTEKLIEAEKLFARVRWINEQSLANIMAILYEEANELNSQQGSGDDFIKKLLKTAMARLHPDTGTGNPELFKIVSSVYDTLKRDNIKQGR